MDLAAPIPTYEIDRLLKGRLFKRPVSDEDIVIYRRAANAALVGAYLAMEEYIETPAQIRLANMLFDDLLQICSLISRIEKIDPTKIARLIKPSGSHVNLEQEALASGRATRKLLSSLGRTKGNIDRFLKRHAARRVQGGNRGLFVSTFIWIFGRELGIDRDFWVKVAPFSKVLAAAWRDVGLPFKDHRGRSREPLENWFSDRLGHFVSPEEEGALG